MEGIQTMEISETNRGREQIIINRKFKYNFSKIKKDNIKIYRCTEYKTYNKCKSFIILNDNKEVLKYECLHNHPGKEIEVVKSLVKHKIKDKIRKSSIPSDINLKRTFDEISENIGYICPEYKTIKSQIARYINKQLFPNIKAFNEAPNESEFYKTIRDEYFMIFKNSNLIIFQSPFQAKLFMEHKNIFADGTFYIAPPNTCQVFITRTYVTELNGFYTTSMSILKNKEQTTYEILFDEIKKNVIKYNANIDFSEKNFHCDFEKGISNAVENIFPNINIKYCIWHYKKLLMIKKNKLCYKEVDNHNILNCYYKAISNLCFVNPEYIPDIFNKIKNTCQRYKSTCSQFLRFLDYFEKTFLNTYKIKYWNYYNNIDHITNNASESYNSYLKKLFAQKPTFYKLIYEIQFEESKSYNDYQRRIGGIWRKKRRISESVDEINNVVEYYKNMETELKNIGSSKNEIVESWFNCLIRLNNKAK